MFDIRIFSEQLKRSRVACGFTQGELAERLMVTPQSVSRWECGEAVPDVQHLSELSDLLGVSLDLLLKNRSPRTAGLIGVDAGGTKTEFVLVDEQGNLYQRVVLEGSNPNVCGIEETVRIARRGIGLLHPNERNVRGVFFGGAGMGTGNHADVLATALRKFFPGIRIWCDTDAINVIACSSQPQACIAAISGTGSVVYSSDHGSVERVGGTGYMFEKLGSGFDVGRDAITAALRERDGVGEKTLLTAAVEQKLGGTAWDHIRELYRRDVGYIASFAPLVSAAAEENDPVAREILRQNGGHIAGLISAVAARKPHIGTVVLSGSMLTKDHLFREAVLGGIPPRLTVEVPEYPPVFGACLQCARLLGLLEMPRAENFLKETAEKENALC